MLSKCVEIPIQIKPEKLLRFFESLNEPFNMDRRLGHECYAYSRERLVIEAVYRSQVSNHLGDRITCSLRFELQSKEEMKSGIVVFGKHEGSLNKNVEITPLEQLNDTKINLVLKEIKTWLQSAEAKVKTEKKTFYAVGRLRTPNCLPDGLYEFEDFSIFPLKEKGTNFCELSGKRYYSPRGYQCGIYFKLEAFSIEHANVLAEKIIQRYASILSLLMRTEIGLDSNLKHIAEKAIEYNECDAINGSRWEIDRSDLQRRPLDKKLKVPTDFENLYKHYKMLNDKLRRKFEDACSAYRLGLLEMHRHPEISQLAFISTGEALITKYPKALCGRKCPYCGEEIKECHRSEGYVRGFREIISNYTKEERRLFSMDTRLEEDLNKNILPEELKNIFKANGFPLSDNATIKNGGENEWVVADEEKFIVMKEDEKLNIYEDISKILGELYGERGGTVHKGKFFRYVTFPFAPISDFITENGEFYPPHVEFRNRLDWLEMMVYTSIVNWLLSVKNTNNEPITKRSPIQPTEDSNNRRGNLR